MVAVDKGIGCLLAAITPFAARWLRDLSASYSVSWQMLAGRVLRLLLRTLSYYPAWLRSTLQG